ncbi:MAG: TonB-dependent receptor [Proteobacteria bacterium]|nr:TonB-dependent receptor [Pseudomonadota bacterium]
MARRIASVLLGSISLIALTAPVWAAPDSIEEVVVTASKRAEKLQNVPMSVSAVSGDALQHLQATSFADLVSLIPSMASSASDPGHTRLILRGINTNGIGATLGTYIDETPFGSSNALANGAVTTPNIDTFDMARVEVLRGPQGTLYGATTLGGLLKFVTNAPDPSGFDDLFQVGINDVAHGGIGWSGKGMLNIPLADNFAVRGVLYHNDTSGFIDDPVRGKKNINGTKDTGGRLSALWQATPDLTIRVTGLAQNLTLDGSSAVDVTYVPSATSPSGLAYGLTPFSGPYQQSRTAPEPSTVRYRLYNTTIDWNLGFGTLTSATSYGKFTDHSSQDVTALYGTLLFTDFRQKKFTQELRLASPDNQKLEWLAGFYYTHETEGQLQNIAPTRHGVGLGTLTFDSGYAETAGFLDFTYHFTDAFDIALGGRYAGNSQHANEFGLASARGDSSENVFTWSIAPSWHLNENAMVYARVAKGYQPGGPNVLPPAPPPAVPKSFNSDTLINYELGFKDTLDDGRLSLDVDAFYINWNSIQLLTYINSYSVNGNGGTATSKGFEWNAAWTPVDGLDFRFGGAYVDAYLTADTDPILIGAKNGDPLPYVPKWSMALDGDYHFAPTGDFAPFVGTSWRYVGQRFTSFDASFGQTRYPSYNEFDLRAGVDYKDWAVEFYAKNVTDKRAFSQTFLGGSAANGGAPVVYIDQPRTIGVTLTAKL